MDVVDVVTKLKVHEAKQEKRNEALEQRIVEVANHIINTGDSFRVTGKKFNISVTTVFDYCKRFEKMYPDKFPLLREKVDFNAEETVKENRVVMRVLNNTKLLLSGKSVEQISEMTDVGYWTVYRDLTTRLPKIDVILYEEVKSVLKNNSRNSRKSGLK